MGADVQISAIVPVCLRTARTAEVGRDYIRALQTIDSSFEIIFVVDGEKPAVFQQLMELSETDQRVRIVKFARAFGEATAVSAGFSQSRGEVILTLPAYYQVDADELPRLLDELRDRDMVVAHRFPRAQKSTFEAIRRKIFHWLIRVSSGEKFSDLGCSVRAIRRQVLEEINIYGEQYSFLPLIASKRGFKVAEVALKQSPDDRFEGRYKLKYYLHRILDIFSVVFLVRFTKKPIRFFGMVGSITFIFGAIFLSVVIIQRLFFDMPLADRPALLVSSLLTVLGLQIFALGLIGELIIFTHAKGIKEYTIEKIVN